MPNDAWQKFANLRLLFAWQYAHPGKKLLFMGGELAQWHEWRQSEELDWPLCSRSPTTDPRPGATLTACYRTQPALHRHDFEQQGFEWIDCRQRPLDADPDPPR